MTDEQITQKNLTHLEGILWGWKWTTLCFKIWRLSMTTSSIFTNSYIFDCLSVTYWLELK